MTFLLAGDTRLESNMNFKYAQVYWTPEDVQDLRPEWSLEQCEEFLLKIEEQISDSRC